MHLAELDYALPPELIAQAPAQPRDASCLLVCRLHRPGVRFEDRTFRELPDLLRAGDLLVRNDTRVLAARTHFIRPSGGRLELLFLHAVDIADQAHVGGSDGDGGDLPEGRLGEPPAETWEVLVRGRPRVGETLTHEADAAWTVAVTRSFGDGRWLVSSGGREPVSMRLSRHGETPLPPYIRRHLDDPERYQTTYARADGSAAAPTAGLHFTTELDARLAAAGVEVIDVTLHVGLGTFRPLTEERVEANRLHGERYRVSAEAWSKVMQARAEGRRVIAVGTTAVRTLEHLAGSTHTADAPPDQVLNASTELFITPGYTFRIVDALVTNFHLPRTSLLALVMAFAGVDETRAAYEHAVRRRYRFYSFGDAMMLLRAE